MQLVQLAPHYIRRVPPYHPGKPIADLARATGIPESNIVKLASNENPLGVSPKVREALAGCIDTLARYPDGNGYALKEKISQVFGIEQGRIVLGNGSNDILELVARTFLAVGDSAVYSQYSFAVYPLATQVVGARGIEVPACEYGHDLVAMRAAIDDDTKLVFIANPNNPTGTLSRAGDIVEFLEACPSHVLVVLDEAYTEFLAVHERTDTMALLRRFSNLIVSRTLSKAYGLAGLRIGFGLAHPEVAELMNRVRQPFNVNQMAQVAAIAAFDDMDFVRATVENNNHQRHRLCKALMQLELPFIPSHANFVTFHVGDGPSLNEYMLRHGVIIRPLASYGMKDSVRVSVGLPAENERFIAVLREALA